MSRRGYSKKGVRISEEDLHSLVRMAGYLREVVKKDPQMPRENRNVVISCAEQMDLIVAKAGGTVPLPDFETQGRSGLWET